MGPPKVVFQDGKIIFVRHGSAYIRISANRLIKAGAELAKKVEAMNHTEANDANNIPVTTPDTSQLDTVESVSTNDKSKKTKAPEIIELAEQVDNTQNRPRALDPPKAINLKKNELIKFQQGSDWKEATITGRGKVTGKYRNWFNVAPIDGSEPISINLEEVPYQTVDDTSCKLQFLNIQRTTIINVIICMFFKIWNWFGMCL